jgi:hypothetical protein
MEGQAMTDIELDAALLGWHLDPATQQGLDAHIRRLGEPHRSIIFAEARGLGAGAAVFRSGRAPNPAAVAVARAVLIQRMERPLVGLTETGQRVGETHHRAKLTDADVEQILALHAQGLGYRRIAAKLDDIAGGISRGTVRDVIKLRRRCGTAVRFRRG